MAFLDSSLSGAIYSQLASMGVPGHWITDYLGLGGREYIGKPKQPMMFPNLQLRVDAIFSAGRMDIAD
ncbi:MAG: hypothetical protein ACFE0J_14325 [Elainellaceae cyanobacterium]